MLRGRRRETNEENAVTVFLVMSQTSVSGVGEAGEHALVNARVKECPVGVEMETARGAWRSCRVCRCVVRSGATELTMELTLEG